MPQSTYLRNAMVNVTLRNTAYTTPTTVYVALYTTDPTAADTGTEVTGGSYARQAATFIAPTNGVTSNSANITFPTATANWGTVAYIGIRDALTAGNLLYSQALAVSRVINTNDQLVILTGQLTDTIS